MTETDNAGPLGRDGAKPPFRSLRIGRVTTSPHLRLTPMAIVPQDASYILDLHARADDKIVIPPVACHRQALQIPPHGAPPPTERVETRRPATPIPPIQTPFGRNDAPWRRRIVISPMAKLGATAAALTVIILTFLVPASAPDTVRGVTPLSASLGPDLVRKEASLFDALASDVTTRLPDANVPVTPAPVARSEMIKLVAGPSFAPDTVDLQTDFLAKLTAETVAALRQGSDEVATPDHRPVLRLVKSALDLGQTPAQIDALLNTALQSRSITLPAQWIRPNGRADTAAIIAKVNGK